MKRETTFEELDSSYMIRRKFFVPKDEVTRNYRNKGDPKATDFFIEDNPMNEEEWH